MRYTRYPRTPHVPWSPGATADDLRHTALACFDGVDVVVTEKLDGENTSLYRDHVHARSPDSAHHPSRAWIKRFHDRVRLRIPEGYRVSGESMYARHAIAYPDLESYFYVFAVFDPADTCLDWDATVRFARRLGAPTPRVLYRGRHDEKAIRALAKQLDPDGQEGYVVRAATSFPRDAFASHVAKWVRPDHVQTDVHWMQAAVVPNGLGPRAALWELRSGERVTAEARLRALGASGLAGDLGARDRRLAEALDRIDALGRVGDARLEGAIAAALEGERRARIAALAAPAGTRVARRAADLAGLARVVREPFLDEARPRGLRKMARAADLGIVHALARTSADRVTDELVQWSELHAGEAGLLSPAPLAALRADARAMLAELPASRAQKVWSTILDRWVAGSVASVPEGIQAAFGDRARDAPRVVGMVGPSGSGKSTLAVAHFAGASLVSLDDLRAGAGDRADQSQNERILAEALERLDRALAAGESVVWDGTLLAPMQRELVANVARRHDALTTWVVFARTGEALHATNARRPHAVPAEVLDAQLARYRPPYPGDAAVIAYVDPAGAIADTAGDLAADEIEEDAS